MSRRQAFDRAVASGLLPRIDLLAEKRGNQSAYVFVSTQAQRVVTWLELRQRVDTVASGLRAGGLQVGEQVALIAATTPEFIVGLFAIMRAGGTPFTLPTLDSARRSGTSVRHLRAMRAAGASSALIDAEDDGFAASLAEGDVRMWRIRELERHSTTFGAAKRAEWALLQSTSGSTGEPRAIALSERAIVATCAALSERMSFRGNPHLDVVLGAQEGAERLVSWLPLYHDMGLLTAAFLPAFLGSSVHLMSPLSFVMRPRKWLELLSAVGATFSASPNFGFAHVARKVSSHELAGLDLSNWRCAGMGAEPVLRESCDAFARLLAGRGFDPIAFCPGYGLAENTMTVTALSPEEPLLFESPRAGGSLPAATCGRPVLGTEIRIVDEHGEPPETARVGRIQIRGESLMCGYVADAGRAPLELVDGWFDTGDLGFMVRDHLYFAGRAKELIIRAGRNIHPHEVERIAARELSLSPASIAAFGRVDRELGTERITVLIECADEEREGDSLRAMLPRIRVAVERELGVPIENLALVPPRTIPRTTSGKTMRAKCREQFSPL